MKVTKQKLNKALIFVKRVLRDFKRNKVIEFEGALFEVDPSRALDVEILKGSFTEVAAVRSLLPKDANLGGVMLDVGANAGYWSLPLAGSFAECHAFEPDPEVRRLLTRNRELNDLAGHFEIHAKAVGSHEGTATFHIRNVVDNGGALNDGLGTLLPSRGHERGDIEVQTTTVDTFARPLKFPIALLKIDTEGFDSEILRHASETLNSAQPLVISELLSSIGGFSRQEQLAERLSLFPDFYQHFVIQGLDLVGLDQWLSDSNDADFNLVSIPISWNRDRSD